MIRDIAGHHNHSVKLVQKLRKKTQRRGRGLLVAEGMDLLAAAVENGADIREVLVRCDLVEGLPHGLTEAAETGIMDIGVCAGGLLSSLSLLGGAADVLFICRTPAWSLGDLDLKSGVVVYLEGVGDPGNVGTLVRAGAAFGATAVLCSPGTADPFGPKAMRAGMGSQFVLPVLTDIAPADVVAHRAALEVRGSEPTTVVADSCAGDDIRLLGASGGVTLVLGAERLGPGSSWTGCPRVRIAHERIDSLNVAMAGTILLYELHRARGGKPRPVQLGLGTRREEP